jgi:hypothetical protein
MVREWLRPAHLWTRSTSTLLIPAPRLLWCRATLPRLVLLSHRFTCAIGLHRREPYSGADGYARERCQDCRTVWLTATFDE